MPEPKRIVHMTTVHHPYDPRIYHKECLSLHKHGYDVTLIAQTDPSDQSQDKPIKHIPVKKYKNRLSRMLFGPLNAYKKAKKLNADIYHFHDPELLPIGWLLKNKQNVVIYDIHEDYVTSILQKKYMNRFMRKLFASIYKWVERLFARKMALCLAEKYYQDIYPDGQCILNYPTLNEHFINTQSTEGQLEDKLLYTGNVTEDRGAYIHAKIPSIHEAVEVHFIGKCASPIANKIDEIAQDHKDRIHIEGIDRFVEKEDIEHAYMSHNWLAGIALFPPTEHYMKKELTKFFEYMNAGLPIICSHFPQWKTFIDKYNCGIAVDPYDDEQIKQAIQYLRDNPDIAKQMGQNGQTAVINELNWHTEEQKLINWYEQLLG